MDYLYWAIVVVFVLSLIGGAIMLVAITWLLFTYDDGRIDFVEEAEKRSKTPSNADTKAVQHH